MSFNAFFIFEIMSILLFLKMIFILFTYSTPHLSNNIKFNITVFHHYLLLLIAFPQSMGTDLSISIFLCYITANRQLCNTLLQERFRHILRYVCDILRFLLILIIIYLISFYDFIQWQCILIIVFDFDFDFEFWIFKLLWWTFLIFFK